MVLMHGFIAKIFVAQYSSYYDNDPAFCFAKGVHVAVNFFINKKVKISCILKKSNYLVNI